MKINGALVCESFLRTDVFCSNNETIRDDCVFFLRHIKKLFNNCGVEIFQPVDTNTEEFNEFELHLELQKSLRKSSIKYLIRFECQYIQPGSYEAICLKKYKKVFSWNSIGIDGGRYVGIFIPNTFCIKPSRNWIDRQVLCCMISGNKHISQETPLELYSERVKTIHWFEQHAPQDFDLFGVGWDAPAAKPGFVNRIVRKLRSYLPINKSKVYFPSCRGKVASKLETMQNYRFSICYENVRDLPDYITEKIWDSFFAGCIPVYWGASNITDYIPEDCFIDRRKFSSHEALYKFMKFMPESEYTAYQERIATFLSSEKARPFSAEAFAETIVNTIVSDLGLAV